MGDTFVPNMARWLLVPLLVSIWPFPLAPRAFSLSINRGSYKSSAGARCTAAASTSPSFMSILLLLLLLLSPKNKTGLAHKILQALPTHSHKFLSRWSPGDHKYENPKLLFLVLNFHARKKIWKTTKAPGERKTLQQFKIQITQICLSVCLFAHIHFICLWIQVLLESLLLQQEQQKSWIPFLLLHLDPKIWTMELDYAKGEWNCCCSKQQLPTTAAKKSWSGKAHSSWLPKQDTSDCNSSCSSKLSIVCKVACLKIASALEYQTRTPTQ